MQTASTTMKNYIEGYRAGIRSLYRQLIEMNDGELPAVVYDAAVARGEDPLIETLLEEWEKEH